jgi:glucose/arabinose dehydrogenase
MYTGTIFRKLRGAFVGGRGSWDRTPLGGCKVVFVPFSGGKPSGPAQDVSRASSMRTIRPPDGRSV